MVADTDKAHETEEDAMSAYQLTAAVAHEHVNDLLREAARSRTAAELAGRTRRRTQRRRPLWWVQVTARTASLRTA